MKITRPRLKKLILEEMGGARPTKKRSLSGTRFPQDVVEKLIKEETEAYFLELEEVFGTKYGNGGYKRDYKRDDAVAEGEDEHGNYVWDSAVKSSEDKMKRSAMKRKKRLSDRGSDWTPDYIRGKRRNPETGEDEPYEEGADRGTPSWDDDDKVDYERGRVGGDEVFQEEKEGKGCAESEGGSGCIKKDDKGWFIWNNKKGGIFKRCSSKKDCEDILSVPSVHERLNRSVRITKSQFEKMILKEISISLGTTLEGIEDDSESEAASQDPLPANFGSQHGEEGGMDSIAEDWEDEEIDPHDAPPLGAITGRRGAPGLDIEEVQYWIQQVREMPDGPEKEDMLGLIQNELFRE